jgi:hypothetical protein
MSYEILQNDTTVKNIDLSKKNYYSAVFNKDDRARLKKAESYHTSARKSMVEYYKNMAEIDKLYTIAEATGSSKSREKALSKARNLNSNRLKPGSNRLTNLKKGMK